MLLNIGDNFGDFVDEYRGHRGRAAEGDARSNKDRWGREWIMLANPSYGSFRSAPYKHDLRLSNGDKRKAKPRGPRRVGRA